MSSPSHDGPANSGGHESQPTRHQSQDGWISGEELYTEGSSDEDDMALRIKKRERKETKKGKSTCKSHPINLFTEDSINPTIEHKNLTVPFEPEMEIDRDKWRPSHGKSKLKCTKYSGNSSKDIVAPESPAFCASDEEPDVECEVRADETTASTASTLSLSEAYSNMHKLDALLRDSDRRLKEAQAETLQAQLSTRAQLRALRERAGAAGGSSVVLAKNWDAFMELCPVGPVGLADAALPALHLPGGARGPEGGDADLGHSVLPRASGASSDRDESDSSDSSDSALAITDEEKLKLTALLRELDQDVRAGGGYHLDAEARRSLDDIDGKLQELAPEEAPAEAQRAQRAQRAQGLARGATRQQRLEDIDRCLQALADSALGDVEPVGEAEVRALLAEARAGEDDEGDGDGEGADPGLIGGLLAEARRELPRFRYRHRPDADEDGLGRQKQPVVSS